MDTKMIAKKITIAVALAISDTSIFFSARHRNVSANVAATGADHLLAPPPKREITREILYKKNTNKNVADPIENKISPKLFFCSLASAIDENIFSFDRKGIILACSPCMILV